MADTPRADVGRTTPGNDGLDPLVTVVVPARNEERTVGRCLASILAQSERSLQVVVVDGASSDRTAAVVDRIVATDPRVERIHHDEASIPGSLNAGLRRATGRWLIRVDAHSTIPADYVEKAVARLETGRWGGVGGRKDAVAETTAGRAIAGALSSPFGVGNSVYHYGRQAGIVDHLPFGAYPTELLDRLGGWDERLAANEDFELDYRIRRTGRLLLFDPELRIAWRSRETIGDLFRQYRRYGRGKADVAILHPTSLRLRHLAPPILVIVLSAAVPVAIVAPALAGGILALYGSALLVAAAATARKVRGAVARALVPAAFVAMHIGWGIGFLEGVLSAVMGRGLRSRTAWAPLDGRELATLKGSGPTRGDANAC